MRPLVSILIPAHNAGRWIAETIASAEAQSWEPKEIIIVDDGSTDDTFAVAKKFESSQVRVIRQENQGAAVARNAAYSVSRGDYIQWLDADDLLSPDKISRQMAVLGPNGSRRTLLSGAWGHFLHRPQRARFISTPLWCDLTPAEFLSRKLAHRAHMQTAVWLVSRELTEAAGPWNPAMVTDDDGEYFCRVILNSDRIQFVPDARVYYRLVGSMSLSYIGRSTRKLEALWNSMRLHIGYLRGIEDTPRTRAACLKYLQNYLINFYPQRPDIVEEMKQAAAELGGTLKDPRLPWKYAWIQEAFGWDCAKRAQLLLPGMKWSLKRRWDAMASRVQKGKLAGVEKPTI
ncbi:MAG TPA: glycosyltransferase [Terriglobales bacterium]|nr:glycosyltransferase [Terriglobales bacterium]